MTPAVDCEVQIGRVTFIAAKKIPRVRQRLGFKHPVSHYKERLRNSQHGIFTNADTYAILKTNRDPADKNLSDEFREIQKAFWLFASSFASYSHRKDAAMSLRPPHDSMSIRDIAVFDRSTDGTISTTGLMRQSVQTLARDSGNRTENYFIFLIYKKSSKVSIELMQNGNLR